MYSVMTGDFARFMKFLNSTNSEWINIVLTEAGALFVQNTDEIFSALQLRCERSAYEQNHSFRMKNSVIKLLAVEGSIDITVTGEDITAEFIASDAEQGTIVIVPKHQTFSISFKEKLSLLTGTGAKVDATPLRGITSVAKAVNSFIETKNGVAGVLCRDGIVVCSKVHQMPTFCITALAASTLFAASNHWCCIQNYVCAVENNYGVLVTQCRGSDTLVFSEMLAEKIGAAATFQAELKSVIEIYGKLRKGIAILDFNKGYCSVDSGNEVYRIPVQIEELQVSPNYHESKIVLNEKLLLTILPRLKETTVVMKIKRHFVETQCGGFHVLSK